MNLAKQKLPGSEQEKKSSASYQRALDAEGAAQRMYQSGDYTGARDGFVRAQNLYADAGGEIAAARALVKTPSTAPENKIAEKVDPAVKEREEREAATREINRLLEQYKQSIEQGNLQMLTSILNLSGEDQKNWGDFFKMSGKRKVTAENVRIQPDRSQATVTFTEKLWYENQAEPDPGHAKEWKVEAENNQWRVTSAK
jgi:hypothetical protein